MREWSVASGEWSVVSGVATGGPASPFFSAAGKADTIVDTRGVAQSG